MLRIFPEKRKWYLMEPENEIDRRIYRYYEVFKRLFWLIYKKVGVIEYNALSGKDINQVLTSKFCQKKNL